MIERILIKRDPETYVVCADSCMNAITHTDVPVVGKTYGKFKCVCLNVTRCHNLTDTFVVVASYEVQLPEEYFMRIGDAAR